MNHFAAIREHLDEYGLDAMLLTCAPNRYYASGFASSGTDGVALITKEKNYYYTDSRYIEAAGRLVQDAEIAQMKKGREYEVLINEAIERHGLRTVGFEDEYMTVAGHAKYAEKLHCELKAADKLLSGLRAVKDEEELSLITSAQRIAERALDDILNEIRPGVTERELAARLIYLMLHYGAENISFDPIVVSGPNGSMPHGVPGEKEIAEGDFVTMDFGALFHGYCSDMTRTVAVGYVTEEMDRVYHTVLDAQLAGLAAVHAGIPGKQVDAAAREVIKEAGYGEYFGHGFGHSVGVEIHEKPYVGFSSEETLPAGAVVTAEPGIYIPGRFGVRIEDMFVVRETGAEVITKAPKELLVLPARRG